MAQLAFNFGVPDTDPGEKSPAAQPPHTVRRKRRSRSLTPIVMTDGGPLARKSRHTVSVSNGTATLDSKPQTMADVLTSAQHDETLEGHSRRDLLSSLKRLATISGKPLDG